MLKIKPDHVDSKHRSAKQYKIRYFNSHSNLYVLYYLIYSKP